MNKHLQNYLDSFKVKKEFWTTFFIDIIFFGLITLIFTWFGTYLQNKSTILMGGRTPEQIQELVATAPEQALPFLFGMKRESGSMKLNCFTLFSSNVCCIF